MSAPPVICFGQQPCGFFPKRFLVAKVWTARRLQKELGGEIVFFYHDADHDPRETRTTLRQRQTHELAHLNFNVENKTQRKFSPLFLKRITPDWQARTALQLVNYVERPAIDLFNHAAGTNPADFCLDMDPRMGLLEGIRVARSSDPALRRAACDVGEFFADVHYDGEIVRARFQNGELTLHSGGDAHIRLAPEALTKEQITPTRDTRLRWMQSVIHCTHYIAGLGEQAYLHREDAPEITFVRRDEIERADEAHTEFPPSDPPPLLAFGAHPDDIEFGCGGVIAGETRAGRAAHFVVCSRGEAGTHGTPEIRTAEAEKAAEILGATIEFTELDGDAHLEIRAAHAIKLAAIIRRRKPGIVLAPTLAGNQHPDHGRLGHIVRDAIRLARYGGLAELRELPPHTGAQLFFYAITPEAEPTDVTPLLVSLPSPEILAAWTAAMEAHASQVSAHGYIELQIMRARMRGLRSGVSHAIALYPNEPVVLPSLTTLTPTGWHF